MSVEGAYLECFSNIPQQSEKCPMEGQGVRNGERTEVLTSKYLNTQPLVEVKLVRIGKVLLWNKQP